MATLFISDLHLGSFNCQVDVLATFLQQIRTERLYLVGDVFDLWWMTRYRSRFGRAEQRVVALIDRHARAGA